jgi:hypothetical protein
MLSGSTPTSTIVISPWPMDRQGHHDRGIGLAVGRDRHGARLIDELIVAVLPSRR